MTLRRLAIFNTVYELEQSEYVILLFLLKKTQLSLSVSS